METVAVGMDPLLPMAMQAPAARVLVVEDDDEMRALVEEILKEEGYSVIGAADTFSALVQILGEGADAIVTDWKMPVRDGIDLLRSVRRSLPGLPVVLVTAYPDPDLRAQALKNGADSFLAKPFHRGDLLAHVKAALAAGRVRRERRGQVRFPSGGSGQGPSAP